MFGIYDDLTPDHVPGLQKYDKCMTEQVPGPQGVKIVGRHMPSAPYCCHWKVQCTQCPTDLVRGTILFGWICIKKQDRG